jgi:Domain of unknown function (DUF4440)
MLYGTLENGYVMTRLMWSGWPLLLLSMLLLAQRVERVQANEPATDDADGAVIAELRENTQALLDAIAPGDVSVWQHLLDDQILQTDENDVVRRKDQILAELKPLPAGLVGHLSISDFVVVRSGEVAIVSHEDNEYLDYHGQVIRSRFRMTDTWVRRAEGWRELGSQVLAVLQDPPALPLPGRRLRQYTGNYQLTPQISGTFLCQGDDLIFRRTGRPDRHFLAEVADVFFEPGEPRTRRIFKRNASGHITGFVDRREARDILWQRSPD